MGFAFIAVPDVLHVGIDGWVYPIKILELINEKVDVPGLRQFHNEFEYRSKRHSFASEHWYVELCANLVYEYFA